MTSKPGPRKPSPKIERPDASSVKPAGRSTKASLRTIPSAAARTRVPWPKNGERHSALKAEVDALESELKKSKRRLQREVRRRERAESELRQNESRFQSLTAFGDHHLFVMDTQGRYLLSNRENGLLVGGECLPFVGRNQREFHPREVAELYEERMRAVLETGRAVEFEHVAPEPDGLHHHLDTLYPIEENGRIAAIGGICRDVTGQRDIQHRLQHALDATAEGIWDWNIRTGEVIFSRNWKTSLGYSPEEVPDRVEFWESILHPEDLPQVRQALDDHFAGRSPLYVCENRLRMKSGEYRANLDRGKVVERDASGQPVRMVGTDTDISARRKALGDLLQAKNDLEAIFNAAQQAVFLMDPDGTIINANEEVARRLKRKAGEMVGRCIYDFLPAEVADGRRRRVAEVLRTRKPVQFEDRRAGRTISQTLYPVFDSKGSVVRLAVYGQDVTDERLAEARMRESDQMYRSLFDSNLDAIFVALPDGTITDANAAACAMFGMSREEIRRASRAGIVVGDANLESALEARRQTGKAASELTFVRADGTTFIGETSSAIIADASGGARAFVIVHDITGRKQAELERETTVEFLHQATICRNTQDLIQSAVTFFQSKSGCEAVGVRLREGDDYPYYVAQGFPAEFVTAENSLCARTETGEVLRDRLGSPVLECMCGNVINGRFDPSQPFFTSRGSFWTNSTTDLLAGTSEADRQARTRNRCNGEGFESVALIPLFQGDERLGLLQLNDRRKGLFSLEVIALWERLAGYLSVALANLRAEGALRASEEKHRRIVETANEGIWAMDGDYRTTFVNQHMADMLGFSPGEMTGRRVDAFMFPEDAEDHAAKMAVRQKGDSSIYERRFRRKDGGEVWALVSATALKGEDGRFVGSFAMFTDITLRKRAEEILQVRLRLSEFAETLTLEDLLRQALDEAERITASRIGFIHFVEEDQKSLSLQTWSTNTLRNMCTAEGKGRHYSVDEAGVWVDCIRERRPVIHNDYGSLAHRRGLPPGHAPATRELVVPVLHSDRIVAVLGVGNRAQEYDARDVETLSSLANAIWDVVLRKQAEIQRDAASLSLRNMYRQLQDAREEERRRIAREIHDELGQNITALKIDLAWLKKRVDPGQSNFLEKLESMNDVVDVTLQTVRRVSSELRPGVLDALGLAAAVEWLVRDFEKRSEIQCELLVEPDEIGAGPKLATDIFRILQESLTNVMRHAQATRVKVTLRQEQGVIELGVLDNGIGLSDEQAAGRGSLGILGIRERLLAIGGALNIRGLPGEGTSLRATIPTQGEAGLI